jgi:hypothetical protein
MFLSMIYHKKVKLVWLTWHENCKRNCASNSESGSFFKEGLGGFTGARVGKSTKNYTSHSRLFMLGRPSATAGGRLIGTRKPRSCPNFGQDLGREVPRGKGNADCSEKEHEMKIKLDKEGWMWYNVVKIEVLWVSEWEEISDN